ncbi:peptidase M23 family protein, partial [Vibrio parahaemolyticus V-223/04]
MRSTFRP